eukprot:3289986-Pleurochrysis_carterae.AAC.1
MKGGSGRIGMKQEGDVRDVGVEQGLGDGLGSARTAGGDSAGGGSNNALVRGSNKRAKAEGGVAPSGRGDAA